MFGITEEKLVEFGRKHSYSSQTYLGLLELSGKFIVKRMVDSLHWTPTTMAKSAFPKPGLEIYYG